MIRSTFRFIVPTSPELPPTDQKKWAKEIYRVIKPLVDSCTSLGDCEVDLDSPNLPELLSYLRSLHNKRVAWMNSLEIEERYLEDEQTRVEWFVLAPKNPGEFGFRDVARSAELFTCKADRFRAGVHVAGFSHLVAVSERVKAVAEANKLKGIEFLWVKDTGKYRAPQWYLPIVPKPLGRGLDHPWLDPKKLRGRGTQTAERWSQYGQHRWIDSKQFRTEARYGNRLKDELVSLAIAMSYQRRGFTVESFPRVLRDYLPRTDFAFTVEDGFDGKSIIRGRGVAINRKTRDLLVANRLLTEEECIGVCVLDKPYKGAELLDRKYGVPQPLFSPEQLKLLRAKEKEAWEEYRRNPKPVRAPSLKRALTLLRARKRYRPKDFGRPASKKGIADAASALGREIPIAWQKVFRISNGGTIRNCEIASGYACTIS